MMKQKLLKTMLLGLMVMLGTNAWADGVNLLTKASTITASKSSSETDITCTQNEKTKAITVTPGKNVLYQIKLSDISDVTLDPSQIFVVVEAAANTQKGGTDMRARKMNIGGKEYDDGRATGTAVHTTKLNTNGDGTNTRDIIFLATIGSIYKNNTTEIADAFMSGENLALTSVQIDLHSADSDTGDGEITIYSIGFYNLSEIVAKYSNLSKQWQIVNTDHLLRLENGGSNNKIRVKDAIQLTSNEAALMLKSLGSSISSTDYNTFEFQKLSISSGDIFKSETMSNLSSYTGKVQLSDNAYVYFPTMNKNVYVLSDRVTTNTFVNYKYYQYKNGEKPNSNDIGHETDPGQSTGSSGTYRYMSLTRPFVKGYNTMVVPFEVNPDDLTARGLTAYTFTDATAEGEITFTKQTETIAHSTPMIIKADKEGLYLIPRGAVDDKLPGENNYKNNNYATSSTYNNITFVGSWKVNTAPTSPYNATKNYGINSDGDKFLKMKEDTKTSYYRAFLADGRPATAHALTLSFDNGDGVTSIVNAEEVEGLGLIDNGVVYNLQGVRMNGDNLPRGIYVKNGKKFVVQ